MNLTIQLLNDIKNIVQQPSLSNIEKDIALEKTRKLYEEIIALPIHAAIETHQKKETGITPQPFIESVKTEVQQIHQTPIHSAAEIKNQETIQHEPTSESLNDILNKHRKTELADRLEHSPIKDLKAFIGFNDKFSFIQNLFEGNDAAYKNAIEQFNSFENKNEAEKLIHELSNKHKWHENMEVSEHFKEIISRKFL